MTMDGLFLLYVITVLAGIMLSGLFKGNEAPEAK